MAYELSPLPYDYAALEPHIDAETMKLHHDKHHQGYVNNLNGAVEKHPDLGKHTAEDLLRNLNSVPEDVRTTVRNNGGGHVNHTMFWKIMKPGGGGEPSGKIADQIKKDFGDFAAFKKQFKYGFKLHFEKIDGTHSLIESLQDQIRLLKPSVVVMFTNQKRTTFQKLFLSSKSEALSFRLKVPLLVFNKTAPAIEKKILTQKLAS